MSRPLYDALTNYIKEAPVRFHMPGHFGDISDPLYASAPFDVTELGFDDNLNCPSGVILEAEQALAKFSNVYDSLFFTAGTTSTVRVAMGVLRFASKNVAIDTFSHKSVFEGARGWGFNATLIPRTFNKEGFAEPIKPAAFEAFMDKHPEIGAVTFTSPDFFGRCLDLESLCDIAHKRGCTVFVDSAHGAHLRFSPLLPKPATEFADIVCESWHKTLPVFTGGSVLHISRLKCFEGQEDYPEFLEDLSSRARLYRAKTHTTSPSYLTMAAIDASRDMCSDWESKYVVLLDRIKQLKKKYPQFKYLKSEDPTRFTLTGYFDEFVKYGVEPEMTFGRWVNFILTPYNMAGLDALDEAMGKCTPNTTPRIVHVPNTLRHLPKAVSPADKMKLLPLEDTVGCIAASDIGAYPPGVPILYEGQTIRRAHVEYLTAMNGQTFNVVNKKICVIIK